MVIVQTPVRFHPYRGGVERVALEISRGLVARGHRVVVLCADDPRHASGTIDGVEVIRLPTLLKVANTNITPMLPWRLAREPFDLIHTHIPTPWSADWSAFTAWIKSRPLVLTYHNNIVGSGFAGGLAASYNGLLLPRILRSASRVITNSPSVRVSLLSKFPDLERKLVVLPNGVDIQRLHPGPNKRLPHTIGFLSVLDEYHAYKGLHVLIDAIAVLASSAIEIKLQIAGDGPARSAYESYVARCGVADRVHFMGPIPEGDLASFYRSCSVFVLPSVDGDQEGFGIVAAEAMACATPVIVTEACGIASLIREHSCGLVIPPKDHQALARQLRDLLNDPQRRREMGAIARRTIVRECDWNNICAKLEGIYESCLSEWST